MAVLDSSFRVRGTKLLRVIKASVFPKIPGYYFALPVYIISEKAADAILADA
jgi:choline dehydrogenase